MVIEGEIVGTTTNFDPAHVTGEHLVHERLGIRPRDLHRKFPGIAQNDLLPNGPVLLIICHMIQPLRGHTVAVE